jgi:hypothetical protein
VHVVLEGGVVVVFDGLHAGGECGVDVLGLVVDEEDVFRWGLQALGGVAVDCGFGFGDVEGVGPGVVVEGFDPGVAGAESGLHGAGHVGEDAGADAGALEALDPVEHRWVEGGPHVRVGCHEIAELGGGDDDAGAVGDGVPEGVSVEVAAIVGVAVGPVLAVEGLFAEAGDGAHASPGGWVGRAGEDHAVVEEDCLDGDHKGEVNCMGDVDACEGLWLRGCEG